jgi:DNA-binding CsgD family transcriptional regulator/tetratricopeptide (TPR) repeat protein
MTGMPRRVSSPDFVGRAEELAILQRAMNRAAQEETAVVLIGGEAGVGKTRLVREFSSHARATGARVVVGSCVPLAEGLMPYAAVVDILRDVGPALVRSADPSGLLSRLVEEPSGAISTSDPAPRDFARGRLLASLHGLCLALSEEAPIVAIFEDLHWADASTRDALAFLARQSAGCRLFLVATYRDDELPGTHPLWPLLAETQRAGADHIELRPFGRAEVVDQLRGILRAEPDDELVDLILSRSDGNPFFAEELLAAGAGHEPLPGSLRNLLLERVHGLPAAARDVVHVAAVAGRRVDHRLLMLVARKPEDELLAHIRAAVERQVLVPVPSTDSYAFRHALVREAVYDGLLAGERIRLHREYAEALSDDPRLSAAGVASAAAELAYHWTAARDDARALEASVRAGLAAEHSFAFAEAHRHFERALDLWSEDQTAIEQAGLDLVDIHRHTAEMAYLAGSLDRAVALCQRGIEYADDDCCRAGLMHERLGRYLTVSGHDEESVLAAYRQAVRLVPDEPSRDRARVLAAMGQALMLATRYDESRRYAEAAVALARQVGDAARSEESHALCTLGVLLTRAGEAEQSVAALRTALAVARDAEVMDDIHRAYANLSDALRAQGEFEQSEAIAMEGVEVAGRYGVPGTIGVFLLGNALHAMFCSGRWDEAERRLRLAGAVAPGGVLSANLHAAAAELTTARGRFAEADQHLEAATGEMTFSAHAEMSAELCAREAELAAWRNDRAEVRRRVAKGLAVLELGQEADIAARLAAVAVRVAADEAQELRAKRGGTGGHSGAEDLAALVAAIEARNCVTPMASGYFAVCQAELSRLATGSDPAPWEAVVAHWDRWGCPYFAAYARWRLAEARLLAGARRELVAEDLATAHNVATRLGAAPLLREIEALLLRARMRLPSPRPEPEPETSPLGLTRREMDVLAMLGAGATNRQISRSLFISEKTVSVHVSHILAKLSVANRGEAAAEAYRMGLIDVGKVAADG